jgi:hypothetical protein
VALACPFALSCTCKRLNRRANQIPYRSIVVNDYSTEEALLNFLSECPYIKKYIRSCRCCNIRFLGQLLSEPLYLRCLTICFPYLRKLLDSVSFRNRSMLLRLAFEDLSLQIPPLQIASSIPSNVRFLDIMVDTGIHPSPISLFLIAGIVFVLPQLLVLRVLIIIVGKNFPTNSPDRIFRVPFLYPCFPVFLTRNPGRSLRGVENAWAQLEERREFITQVRRCFDLDSTLREIELSFSPCHS